MKSCHGGSGIEARASAHDDVESTKGPFCSSREGEFHILYCVDLCSSGGYQAGTA